MLAGPGWIRVDVQELTDHFGLDKRMTRCLDEQMKTRKDTLEGDIEALYDILERARSPAGLLSVKLKEMQEGTFVGRPKLDPDIMEFKKKFGLDNQAVTRLAESKNIRKATWDKDVDILHKHLETSSNASARVMMMLSKLKSGADLGEPDKRVAPGRCAEKQGNPKEKEKPAAAS